MTCNFFPQISSLRLMSSPEWWSSSFWILCCTSGNLTQYRISHIRVPCTASKPASISCIIVAWQSLSKINWVDDYGAWWCRWFSTYYFDLIWEIWVFVHLGVFTCQLALCTTTNKYVYKIIAYIREVIHVFCMISYFLQLKISCFRSPVREIYKRLVSALHFLQYAYTIILV